MENDEKDLIEEEEETFDRNEELKIEDVISFLSDFDVFYGPDGMFEDLDAFADALENNDTAAKRSEVITRRLDVFKERMNFAASEGLITVQKEDGSWGPLESAEDFNPRKVKRLLIRKSVEDEPYAWTLDEDTEKAAMSAKPLNEEELANFASEGHLPKPTVEGHWWGPFQALRWVANKARTLVGASPLPEYKEYEDAMKVYNAKKYYALKFVGENPTKNADVIESDKKSIVRAFMVLNFKNFAENELKYANDGPFANVVKDLLQGDNAKERFEEMLLKAPEMDNLLEATAVKNYLKSAWDQSLNAQAPDPESDMEEVGKIVEDLAKKLVDDQVKPFADERQAAQQKIDDLEQHQAEAGKEIENVMNAQRREGAAKVSYQVEKIMELSVDNAKSRQFLNVLKESMSENTAEAWGIKHFLQDCVKIDDDGYAVGRDLLQGLYDRYNPEFDQVLVNNLKSIVNPQPDGYITLQEYGKLMPPELQEKQEEITKSVEYRLNSGKTQISAKKTSEPAPETEKSMGGIQ